MSASDAFITQIAGGLSRALTPLSSASSPDGLGGLLVRLGWSAAPSQAVVAAFQGVLTPLAELASSVARGAPAANLATAATAAARAVAALGSMTPLAGAGAPFDDSSFWHSLPAELFALLLAEDLEQCSPRAFGILSLIGVLVCEEVAADPASGRAAFRARRLDWSVLVNALSSPQTWFSDVYGWGDTLDQARLLDALAALGAGLGGAVSRPEAPPGLLSPYIATDNPANSALRLLAVSPFVAGDVGLAASLKATLLAAAVPPAGKPRQAPGRILLVPVVTGAARASIGIDPAATLSLAGDFQASPIRLLISPVDAKLEGMSAGATLSARTDIEPDAPSILLGSAGGTRFELSVAHLELTARATTDGGGEVVAEIALDEAALVLDLSDGDGFLRGVFGAGKVTLPLALGVAWSSDHGLRWIGGGELLFSLPVNLSIGGVLQIREVVVALGPTGDGAVALRATVDGGFALGPFAATLEGLGVTLSARPTTLASPGNLGTLDLAFAFAPPTRIGFSLDAGAVSGRGFIEHLSDSDRYVGGLSLDIVAVGVDALAIIDASLPGNPDGFALFASLSLRFPSIPLGFGFSLSGLGGLLALNRGVDTQALALGMRDGAADAILFPDDPVRDAALLVAQIDQYFPPLAGNTVVGPVAEIRWGVGDILIGQLGLAISLPQGLIVVLASIEAVLPDRRAPVLELHLDVLGVLDLEEGSLLVVGSLYDSRLLGAIELSGDTAIYVSWLDDPYFVLSVGGFHPGFTPPGHVPSVLEDLRRMRAEIDLGLGVSASVESYFAVTSNTVQFGGGFEIEASAKYLLVTYTARGWFDFDVLLRFAPFLILADASAGVGVYANDKELLGVNLAVHLEGPQPWFASGDASFKFFGIKVKFDFAVGGHAPPQARASSDVLALVRAELANPAAWSVQRAMPGSAGLLLASSTTDGLVRPDDVLVARQSVAPLERTIARLGETTPLQTELSITRARLVSVVGGEAAEVIGELEVGDALGWFAPAQYDIMSDRARLSSPSYEQLIAGVAIGAPGVALPDEEEVFAPEGHETEVWTPATNTSIKYLGVKAPRPLLDAVGASLAAQAAWRARAAAVDVPRIELAGQTYVTIDATTGQTLSGELQYAAAVAATRGQAGVRVVPAHAGAAT